MVKTITATLAVLALTSSAGHADTLLLDGIDMDTQTASSRPKSGMSMTAVESTYGHPDDLKACGGSIELLVEAIERSADRLGLTLAMP